MTLGSHQTAIGRSQDHITPRWIIDRLGPFKTDPCAADPRPWDCAEHNITAAQDGLRRPWRGYVWLNPPFEQYIVGHWIERLAEHGNGIALLHARCEARWFVPCWQHASGILFLGTRLKFCRADGSEQPYNSGAPPVLVAFGKYALARLEACGIPGQLVTAWKQIEPRRMR
jgi:DNA N-6-adenine-methyltransferase (Dam)